MKSPGYFIFFLFPFIGFSQPFDTARYNIKTDTVPETNNYFTNDLHWRGADGAASVDIGNGKILWLFSDSFICTDSSKSRKKSVMVRNSIAIQNGYTLKNDSLKFYWDERKKGPQSFFQVPGNSWYWTGHGTMIKDKLLVFLMKVHAVKTGLGFEAYGWAAVLISNPQDEPAKWKKKYIAGAETYGLLAGSAAVLKDEKYMYAYGAVEPATHEVYVLRWKITDAYNGHLAKPEWWINGKWMERKSKQPVPPALFIGGTEYSVHYDPSLKKYIQVQSFGFGEASIGIRMADSIHGKWTEPYMIYKPVYPVIKKPFMYAAKAHPEIHGDGIYITYNVNSFDFDEVLENQTIYFPKIIKVRIETKE